MKDRIKAFQRNPQSREVIIYLIVGVLTTVISWSVKFLWNIVFFQNTLYPDTVQNTVLSVVEWIAGVLFAYPVNRKWVFRSVNKSKLKEFTVFVLSRIGTLVLNILLMQVLVHVLRINVYISTGIAAVAVVISNYFLGKRVVFTKTGTDRTI